MSTTCYGLLRLFIFLALVAGAAASRFGALDAPPRGGASAGLSSKVAGPLQSFARTVRGARDHLVAAGVARSVSIFALYPMDTVKTRMQMGQEAPLRLAGIFRGVGGSLAGQVPYGVLTFGSYETYKKSLLERFPNVRPIFMYALAAVMGDLTGSGVLCPSEVVKQKMQAGMYKTTGEAYSNIWKSNGLLGFYEGYLGGITRDVPFRVAQLTSYELTKNLYLRIKKRRQGGRKRTSTRLELTPTEAAICGGVAGTFSAAITSPLDRVKTLLMTDSAAYGGSVASCMAKIWREEGVAGLTVGLVPRVTYIAPSVVVFFVAYEVVQQKLKRRQSSQTN